MTENEMVGQHHQLDGHEFEQALGDGEGQRSLACCSPWGHKQLDMTERLNNNPRQSTDTVQTLSNYQWHFSQNQNNNRKNSQNLSADTKDPKQTKQA